MLAFSFWWKSPLNYIRRRSGRKEMQIYHFLLYTLYPPFLWLSFCDCRTNVCQLSFSRVLNFHSWPTFLLPFHRTIPPLFQKLAIHRCQSIPDDPFRSFRAEPISAKRHQKIKSSKIAFFKHFRGTMITLVLKIDCIAPLLHWWKLMGTRSLPFCKPTSHLLSNWKRSATMARQVYP